MGDPSPSAKSHASSAPPASNASRTPAVMPVCGLSSASISEGGIRSPAMPETVESMRRCRGSPTAAARLRVAQQPLFPALPSAAPVAQVRWASDRISANQFHRPRALALRAARASSRASSSRSAGRRASAPDSGKRGPRRATRFPQAVWIGCANQLERNGKRRGIKSKLSGCYPDHTVSLS